MKLEGYILEIFRKLEEKGYEAYLVGNAILLHTLEKPIEEYDMITSAPLFFLPKGKVIGNQLIIKSLHIFFATPKNEYKKQASFTIDLVFYHPHHGLIGESRFIQDLEERRVRILSPKNDPILVLRALCYHYRLQFILDSKMKIEAMKEKIDIQVLARYLKYLLEVEEPSSIFLKYASFFTPYFLCPKELKILDFIKNIFSYRLAAFLFYQEDIEKWLYAFSVDSILRKKIQNTIPYIYLPLDETIFSYLLEKEADIPLWFSLNRAIALMEEDFLRLKKLDSLGESLEKFLQTKIHRIPK